MTDFLNYLIQEKTLQLLTANPQDSERLENEIRLAERLLADQ